MDHILEILKNAENGNLPEAGTDIPHGDMPGDQVCIGPDHISKSKVIFAELLKILPDVIKSSKSGKAVICSQQCLPSMPRRIFS